MNSMDTVFMSEKEQQLDLHNRTFPICPKCNTSCSKDNENQLVKAFNQVYHDHCFICEDCQKPIKLDSSYPIINNSHHKRILLCREHYDQQMTKCPHCISPTESHYEFQGTNYCRFHYSELKQVQCNGCNQAILKQFVEHKEIPNQIWHPECYMIYKFWSIKLVPPSPMNTDIIQRQLETEKKIKRVWTDLSSFEESSANCISDMLLNVAAGAYIEGIRMANQFIMHLDVLFSAIDVIRTHLDTHHQEIDCSLEASILCKQMIRFFELLTIPSTAETSITQELLSLVTGLAQNLKSLIRIGLSAALHLEHLGVHNAILEFLNQLLELEKKRVWIAGRYWFKDPPQLQQENWIEQCHVCHLMIQDTDCYQIMDKKWHPHCFHCTQCSTQLHEYSATLNTDTTLYCRSCCTQQQASNAHSCTHVTLLQQHLYNLKLYLAKLSCSSSTSTSFIGESTTKHPLTNEIVLPETKRQKSILRLLTTANQQKKRMNSVNLGHIHHHLSNQTISTDPSTTRQSSPTTKSSVMVQTNNNKSINKLTSSIRRTFSTNSHSHKKRMSLSNVFDAAKKKRERRSSIMTLDTCPNQTILYLSTLTTIQDYTVRHVAVIAMQPLVTFSMDTLINMIQPTSKKRNHSYDSHQKATALWGKLITHMKSSNSTHTQTKKKTFGVPLSTLVHSKKQEMGVTLRDFKPSLAASFSENASIPTFVQHVVLAILASDMSIEGVFRKNGNIRQLKVLSERIDHSTDNVELLLRGENSIQLAALLKRFLREMPEPLLTFSLYNLFLHCIDTTDPIKRKRRLHLACCLMPKPNRDTMLLIFHCLKWVASFSDTNKMDIPNLARVIAPNVLYNRSSASLTSVATAVDTIELRKSAQEEILVIELLIQEVDLFSTVPSDLILLSLEETMPHDVTELNSKHFIKQYSQLVHDMRKRASKSENNSPVSTNNNSKLSLLLRGSIPTDHHTPKQRRSSWIPGLTTKNK